ncbi:hypothetical protein Scep_007085 [Stephania cephalantha]|uniref:Macrophage erythroblast attacher n=1 Tax=Stephania cephalantha TaxID=152367 RepID=A0AAP0PKQ8_9MAGN
MEPESQSNGDPAAATAPPMAAAAAASVPSPRTVNTLAESLKLEQQLLRVPFEHFKKSIRSNHRMVEKEMSTVISSVAEASNREAAMTQEEAVNHLTSLVSRLQGLKRKLEEGCRVENLQAQRCRARLDHIEAADAENSSEWSNTRLKRILVDYMLRLSYYDTAAKLAASSNIMSLGSSALLPCLSFFVEQEGLAFFPFFLSLLSKRYLYSSLSFSLSLKQEVLAFFFSLTFFPFFLFLFGCAAVLLSWWLLHTVLLMLVLFPACFSAALNIVPQNSEPCCKILLDLVDIDVFHEAKKVIDALQNREVAPALAWCSENKSRLKKSKSKFEFQLRLQEFIELVRADNNLRAITYARKHLAPWGASHMRELQRVMATLAFKSNTECAAYKVFFEPQQWIYLVEQFKQEFYRLYGMTLEPLLNIYLQAGLSALKTPFCYEDDCTKEDPLSQENFRKLAKPLPFSKQQHSKLVCYITKELMDTENPPLVLPNGYVYCTKALEEMAKKNDGKITCPRTGLVCNYSELVKAFIS